MASNTSWDKMAGMLRGVDDEPESIRWMILSYCTKVLLGRNHSRAALIIEEFRDHWYDSKKAGLVISCWNIITGK